MDTTVDAPGAAHVLLRRILDELGLSQAEVARRMGCSNKQVSAIMTGLSTIAVEAALGLEVVLSGHAGFAELVLGAQMRRAVWERRRLLATDAPHGQREPIPQSR